MLMEQAIGDAYAIGWEFAPHQRGANDLATYYQNPNYPEFPAAHYSDDTMRALANANVVLGDPSGWYDPCAYAAQYQRARTVPMDGLAGPRASRRISKPTGTRRPRTSSSACADVRRTAP